MIQALEPLHEMLEAVRLLTWEVFFSFHNYNFRCVHRARLLLERPLLLRYSAESFTRHVKVVVVIECMGTQVDWIKPGTFTTE